MNWQYAIIETSVDRTCGYFCGAIRGVGMSKEIELKKSLTNPKTDKDRLYPSLLCVLVFILSFCLSPYSPLYRYVFSPDEVCYKTISLGLLSGKVPYRDLFDHKGPLAYLIYSLGFLISGKANWGAWIVTFLCNAAAYVFTYKTMRLYRDKEHSFLTVILVMLVTGFCLENVLSNLSKPENMLLLPLMVSTYLFMKETKTEKEKTFDHISNRSMFIIGLMCGAIFMIKLNVCLIYFAFIGSYLLWLLIRKKVRVFFTNTGVFLGGIAIVSAALAAFMAAIGGFSEFIDVYFIFNLKYSQEGDSIFYLNKIILTTPGKITITLLILFTILSIVRDYLKKDLNKQRILMIVLAFAVITVLTMPLVCTYFYIVFLPFYLYGIDCLASIFMMLARDEVSRKQLPVMLLVIFTVTTVFQIIIAPYVPWKKTEEEYMVETYAESHPDATVLFYDRICTQLFCDYMTTIPDFRQFYVPPAGNTALIEEQRQIITEKKPTVVIFESSSNKERDLSVHTFLQNCQYHEYVNIPDNPDDEESATLYMYVQNENG